MEQEEILQLRINIVNKGEIDGLFKRFQDLSANVGNLGSKELGKQLSSVNKDIDNYNRQLNSVNKLQDSYNKFLRLDKKIDTGDKLNQNLKETERSSKSVGSAFGSWYDSIKGVLVLFGSMAASIRTIQSSLGDFEKGLQDIVNIKNSIPYLPTALGIVGATSGLVSLREGLEEARRLNGLLTTEQIKNVSKLAVYMSTGSGVSQREVFGLLTKSLTTATNIQAGAINDADPWFFQQMRRKMMSVSQLPAADKSKALYSMMLEELKQKAKDSGDLLEQPFTKLLGIVKALKESSKGLGEVLVGIGKVSAGILGPLAGGIYGAVKLGSIAGPIALGVGAIASAGLAVLANNFISAMRDSGEGFTAERLGSRATLESAIAIPVISGMVLSGKYNVKVPTELVLSSLSEKERDKIEFNTDKNGNKTRRTDQQIIADTTPMAEEIVKRYATVGKILLELSQSLRNFTKGFTEGFSSIWNSVPTLHSGIRIEFEKAMHISSGLPQRIGDTAGSIFATILVVLEAILYVTLKVYNGILDLVTLGKVGKIAYAATVGMVTGETQGAVLDWAKNKLLNIDTSWFENPFGTSRSEIDKYSNSDEQSSNITKPKDITGNISIDDLLAEVATLHPERYVASYKPASAVDVEDIINRVMISIAKTKESDSSSSSSNEYVFGGFKLSLDTLNSQIRSLISIQQQKLVRGVVQQ